MANPIKISPTPIPATVASAVRSILSLLGTVAVSLGWIKADSLQGFVTIAFTVIATGYGIWKHYDKTSDLIVMEPYVPDDIATKKGGTP